MPELHPFSSSDEKRGTPAKPKRRRETNLQPMGDLLDVLTRARAINDGEHRIDNDILQSF